MIANIIEFVIPTTCHSDGGGIYNYLIRYFIRSYSRYPFPIFCAEQRHKRISITIGARAVVFN